MDRNYTSNGQNSLKFYTAVLIWTVTKLKTSGRKTVIYLITTQNCFLLVPGQDTYKDSGNAKIFDFFEKVPEL